MNKNKKPSDIGGVYEDIRHKMLKRVSRFCSNAQDVEDVVQEAFVKVIEAQHKHKREVREPEAYLHTAARNIAFNHTKSSAFRLTVLVGEYFSEPDQLISATTEAQFEQRENFEIFCRAVRSLPLKCRRVYVLSRVYGFTNKEIARDLGISTKGVEGHLARGTKRCIQFMKAAHSEQTMLTEKEVRLK